MIIRYQNYVEKCMKKKWKKGGNVGHDPMYLWLFLQNLVISHEWGNDRIVIISMIICDTAYGYSSHGGDRKYWSTVTPSIGLFIKHLRVYLYSWR
jgi:hypothetical protein